MKLRRRFLLALMASLALHLGVLTSPSWRLPIFDDLVGHERPVTIEARLAAPPRTVVPTPARPKPQRRRPVREVAPALPVTAPAVPEPLAATPEEPVPEPAIDSGPAPEAEIPPAAPPPIETTLPRRARIHYRVTLGESGFVIGEATQEVCHDDTTYEMRSSAVTTGLAGLFKPVRVVTISVGDVIGGGLRPRTFRIERDKGNTEWANLDWQAARATLSNGRDFPLEVGTQDMLSMFAQLSLMLAGSSAVSLPVVTGKKVERYYFTVLGEERIVTPRGERTALHVRSSQSMDKELTDLWLGREDALLPIKIRHVDRRGDVYEQIADKIEFDAEMEGAP